MVDQNLVQATIFSNKLTNGVLPLDVNDGIFNISLVELTENKHYLRLQDMNGDKVFVSDKESNKQIIDFIDYTPNNSNMSHSFFSKFIELKGKIFASEYSDQNNVMIKLEYISSNNIKKLLYPCSIDEKETNKVEKRDKFNSSEIIPIKSISSTVVIEEKIADNDNTKPVQKLNENVSKEEILIKIRKEIDEYEFIKATDFINEFSSIINDEIITLGIKAEILNHQRRCKECLIICDELLAKDKENTKAKSEKALALRQFRKFDPALVLINEAIKKEPEIARHYFIKAFILNCKGTKNNSEALQVIKKANELKPNYSDGLSVQALILSEMNDKDRAMILFDKAIMLDPKNSFAYNHKGLHYKTHGNKEKARECFEMAVKIDPNFSIAHANLGDYYYDVSKNDKAIECLETAIKCNPNNTHAITRLSVCLKSERRIEEAFSWINKAIENEPDYAWALDLKGQLLYDKKKYAESEPLFEKAATLEPNNPDFLANYGWALFYNDKSSDAFDQFMMALELDAYHYSAQSGKEKIMYFS